MIGALALPAVDTIPAANIEFAAISPVLIVFGAAMLGVLIEALVPRTSRRFLQLLVTASSLVLALGFLFGRARQETGIVAEGSLSVDGPAIVLQATVLIVALLSMLLMAEQRVDPTGDAFAPQAATLVGSHEEQGITADGWLQTEIWPLFLFAVTGMLLFPAANDLLMLFVALEVMSLPLYLLVGLARRRRLLSQEASLKYFLLGAFASAFLLYGSAMLYGFAGGLKFGEIAIALRDRPGPTGLLLVGVGMVSFGLFFKVAAVPFHMWTPDVYQGAPTPITAFMAAGVKVAAFGGFLRVMYVALAGAEWNWRPVFWLVAILTMLGGVMLALTSSDLKRMLAYSSVAHAGFLLLGIIAFSGAGLSATLFYLLAYGLTTIGAFGVLTLVRDPAGEAGHLSSWAGLGKRSPLLAGLFAFFLLAFAGIPLTSGFTAKFAIFVAALGHDAIIPVIVAVLASAISAFFYLRVTVLMFFTDPKEDGPSVINPSWFTKAAIGIAAVATLLLGVAPSPAFDWVQQAGLFLR
ncbi:MAG: NADH-quinone oxidoreductase subunit NuoN [Candidatus Nanopelagicales bacterium]